MSFECNPCHRITTGADATARHIVPSYGRCETCHKSGPTYDCHCAPAEELSQVVVVARLESLYGHDPFVESDADTVSCPVCRAWDSHEVCPYCGTADGLTVTW